MAIILGQYNETVAKHKAVSKMLGGYRGSKSLPSQKGVLTPSIKHLPNLKESEAL